MKSHKFIFLFISILFSIQGFSQANCGAAAPFCAGSSSYTFPASTSTSASAGPDYGCLFSQPNPAWYYFQVSTSGSIVIDISGTGGGDVDFICWGPFTSPTGNCGSLTAGNTVDCSFSASATETCTVPSGIAGEYYMLLITNYSGMTQNINFGQNASSSGSTNCSLLSGALSQTICSGNSTTLTATANLSSTSYTWMPIGLYTPTITVSPTVTTVYTVTIGGTNTVTATYTTVTSTSTVTVILTPSIISSSVTNVKCFGVPTGSIVIIATPTAGVTYSWTPNVSTTSTATALAAGGYTCLLTTTGSSCTSMATFSITQPPNLIASITNTNTTCGLCNGAITTTVSGGTPSYTYSWSPTTNTISSMSNMCSGNYSITVTDANNCKKILTANVLPSTVFQTSISASATEVYGGQTVGLTCLAGASYTWSPSKYLSCLNCASVSFTPYQNDTYCVDVISVDGCTDTACVDITVLCSDVFVPNAFSPNNDGHNDELQIFGNCITEMIFRVYDRWGEVIFECSNINTKWDGKYKGVAVSAGVFVYQLKGKLGDGSIINKKGNITLIK